LPLQVGMSLTANIKLRKVSYLQLLVGEFHDKAESLQRLRVFNNMVEHAFIDVRSCLEWT